MAEILNALIVRGGSTAHRDPFSPDRVADQFLASRFAICCFCATAEGRVAGFQALEWADPDWPGPDRLPADWAIIATYVAPDRQGLGIGRALFAATSAAAKAAGAQKIDATIRRENARGLAYYAKMGFTDYAQAVRWSRRCIAPLAIDRSRRSLAPLSAKRRRCSIDLGCSDAVTEAGTGCENT